MTKQNSKAYGRIGGLTAWSRNGAETMLGAARRGFEARFEREVDPLGLLSPEERAKRAQRARTAWMLTLATRSAEARSNKKAATAGQSAAAAKEVADVGSEPRNRA